MKPLVIYHANCADGFGAAFAAWTKLGDDAEYVPCQHGENGLRADLRYGSTIEGRDVYILDFSFDKDLMGFYFSHAGRVIWLDHHKTAFETWCGEYTKGMKFMLVPKTGIDCIITLDDNKSGALLAWEYFHPGAEVPMLIKHTDDYDRWQFKIPGTKEFNKALWSYAPWSFSQWNKWFYEFAYWENFYTEGEAILRAHSQNVQSVVKAATRRVVIRWHDGEVDSLPAINVFSGLAANCPSHLTSDVGHELATQGGTFGLCWALDKDGKTAKCSLRSNGAYDVSAIAKVFMGGGHRNAAGFGVPISTLLEWLDCADHSENDAEDALT